MTGRKEKEMKAQTIINRIEKEQSCSIATAELLTKALHRENKLDANKAIRFRPLYGDFDIVNADLFMCGEFKLELCSDIGTIEELKKMFL